jgi:hypothetical protein
MSRGGKIPILPKESRDAVTLLDFSEQRRNFLVDALSDEARHDGHGVDDVNAGSGEYPCCGQNEK